MIQQNNKSVGVKPQPKLALFALVAPSALLVLSLLILAAINLIFNPTFWMTGDTEPVNPTPVVITVLNGLFMVTAALGLITLLPGVVVGIFLLTRSKR